MRYTVEKERSTLFEFFKLEINEEIKVDAVYEKTIATSYALFRHQRVAVQKLKSKLYSSNKKVLLHMPTGAGKTRTAINVICDHFRSNEPTLIIWLAHTEELCEQAALEFERAWKFLGNREIEVIKYWGNSPAALENSSDAFIVGGLSKIFNLLKSNAKTLSSVGARCSLVIMDEAHMAVAPTYQLILGVLLSFNSSLLGLSATPGRTWNNIDADFKLSNFFNRQKVLLEIEGYQNPVDYLVKKGYLAKVTYSPLLYRHGLELSEKDQKYLEDYLQLPDKFLKSISEDHKRNILIIQKVEELITRHSRIILFALTVEHANLMAVILQAREINALSITGLTDSRHRKNIIENFKIDSEEPMVLCNYGILTTGFDAPKTSCAVITRPTDSLVLYSQMVGRAIRGKNAGGNEKAEIVTIIDTNLPGFDEVANAFLNWEDVWE